MKTIQIKDFLSTVQQRRAVAIYKSKPPNLHRELLEKVIVPNMAEINRKLGQENDPSYLAYAVEYALSQATK
jgi:hypothetical protein